MSSYLYCEPCPLRYLYFYLYCVLSPAVYLPLFSLVFLSLLFTLGLRSSLLFSLLMFSLYVCFFLHLGILIFIFLWARYKITEVISAFLNPLRCLFSKFLRVLLKDSFHLSVSQITWDKMHKCTSGTLLSRPIRLSGPLKISHCLRLYLSRWTNLDKDSFLRSSRVHTCST